MLCVFFTAHTVYRSCSHNIGRYHAFHRLINEMINVAVRQVVIWLSHPLTMQGSFTSELHVGIPTFNGVLMLRGNVTARNESRHIYKTLLLVHASTTHYTHKLQLKLFVAVNNYGKSHSEAKRLTSVPQWPIYTTSTFIILTLSQIFSTANRVNARHLPKTHFNSAIWE